MTYRQRTKIIRLSYLVHVWCSCFSIWYESATKQHAGMDDISRWRSHGTQSASGATTTPVRNTQKNTATPAHATTSTTAGTQQRPQPMQEETAQLRRKLAELEEQAELRRRIAALQEQEPAQIPQNSKPSAVFDDQCGCFRLFSCFAQLLMTTRAQHFSFWRNSSSTSNFRWAQPKIISYETFCEIYPQPPHTVFRGGGKSPWISPQGGGCGLNLATKSTNLSFH